MMRLSTMSTSPFSMLSSIATRTVRGRLMSEHLDRIFGDLDSTVEDKPSMDLAVILGASRKSQRNAIATLPRRETGNRPKVVN
jgi:hypothetical protein